MLKTVKGTMITGVVIAVALMVAVGGLDWPEEWLPDGNARKLRGDQRRAVIVVDWVPDHSGAMDIQVFWGPNTTGTLHEMESPVQEFNMVEIGMRIEVRAHKHGTRPDRIGVTGTIQTPEGDYPLTMLCTEPTRNSKVCVGVVPR